MSFFKDIFKAVLQQPKLIVTAIPNIIEQTSYEYLKTLYQQYGAIWNEINIFGIRNESDQDKDMFNDYIGIAFNDQISIYKATCDPGKYWTEQGGAASDKFGVAHLCLGFYPKTHQVGIHASRTSFAHEALIQTGNKVKIWRDINKNYKQDPTDLVQSGYFGINIHRSSSKGVAQQIANYSAGCQVFSGPVNFLNFMSIIKNSESYKQNNKYCFSYFLFDQSQIDLQKLIS